MQTRFKPPRIWDETKPVFIIGGGPSLRGQNLNQIAPYRVIGVNQSYEYGDWVDICFWGDWKWWNWNHLRPSFQDYKGAIVTCCPNKLALNLDRVRKMIRKKPTGIETTPGCVAWNHNTGLASISLAYQLGARLIVLLGFDGKLSEDGRKNWHDFYVENGEPDLRPDPESVMKNWRGAAHEIKRDAEKLGVKIYNANPNSAILDFEYREWSEFLTL